MSLRAFIVDDEPLARLRIRDLLSDTPDVEVVGEAGNGPDAVRLIRETRPDVVFLDVQIPGRSGIEVARDLGPGPGPRIVFVTAYDQYAIQAFELQAVDYLLKPVDRERFREALDRARRGVRLERGPEGLAGRLAEAIEEIKSRSAFSKRLAVPAKGRIYFVDVESIEWLDAAGNYVVLHTPSGEHLVRSSLNELEKTLDPAMFLRVHRSTIVNGDRVEEIRPRLRGGFTLVLKSGAKIAASRNFREAIKRLSRPRA